METAGAYSQPVEMQSHRWASSAYFGSLTGHSWNETVRFECDLVITQKQTPTMFARLKHWVRVEIGNRSSKIVAELWIFHTAFIETRWRTTKLALNKRSAMIKIYQQNFNMTRVQTKAIAHRSGGKCKRKVFFIISHAFICRHVMHGCTPYIYSLVLGSTWTHGIGKKIHISRGLFSSKSNIRGRSLVILSKCNRNFNH